MYKTKKKYFFVFLFLLVSVTALFYFEAMKGEVIVTINGKKINAEVVSGEDERARGLSGREELCPACGMLFLFEEAGKHPFWMKGMKFDIDIIWISGNRIVDIKKNVSREKEEVIVPIFPADKVLEISAGQSEEFNIKAGDEVDFINLR